MRLTCRTLLILLLVTILIMAYCSTTVDAGVISRLSNKRRVHARRPASTTYKIKRKTKYKSKTKIRYGHKKPSLFKRIKQHG